MAKLTENEILEKVIQFRADGIDGSSNFFDRMKKAEDFTIGEQYDSGTKEANRASGKFALTIPIIKPQINQIAGQEIQNPQDFIIENTQGGAATIARILTALTKQAADSERVRYEKSQCFRSGLTSGQGVMGVFLDKTYDPIHSNLRIERLNEHNVLFDPNATSYNMNKVTTGGQYVIYEEWIDKDYVKAEYPDKERELEAESGQTFLEVVTTGNVKAIIGWLVPGHKSRNNSGGFNGGERTDIEVMTKVRFLKSHTWWREPKKCLYWFDIRQSELRAKVVLKTKEIAIVKKLKKDRPELFFDNSEQFVKAKDDPKEGEARIFAIEEVVCNVIHHTIRVGNTFLEDREDELNGVDMFPIVPYWPYWVNGYKSGVAEDLIGVQEEINYSHSMALNLVKQLANTGWIIDDDESGNYETWLKVHGSENGIVLNKQKAGGGIEKLKPNPFPTQFELFTEQSLNHVKTITGRLDLPESDPKALSGRAKLLDIQKSTQGSQSIVLNWNYSLAILGDLIVDIIRKNDIFSEDEIRTIVDGDDLLDTELFDEAKGVVIRQFEQQTGETIEPPEEPNPILFESLDDQDKAILIEQFKAEMKTFGEMVEQIEAVARPMAEDILLGLIPMAKEGKYNTKVTASPMSQTMRAIKASETFELHELLIKSGDVGLDGEDLIESTDVPNKEKLIAGRQKKIGILQQAQPVLSR